MDIHTNSVYQNLKWYLLLKYYTLRSMIPKKCTLCLKYHTDEIDVLDCENDSAFSCINNISFNTMGSLISPEALNSKFIEPVSSRSINSELSRMGFPGLKNLITFTSTVIFQRPNEMRKTNNSPKVNTRFGTSSIF